MLSQKEFYQKIRRVKKATSITGRASYSNFTLSGNKLSFKRNNTGVYWNLDINELFEAYRKETHFNVAILKKYMTSRVFSPSIAVLLRIKACDENGNRK